MTPILRIPVPPRRHALLPWLLASAALASIIFAPRGFLPIAANRLPPAAPVVANPAGLPQAAIAEQHSIDFADVGSKNVPLIGVRQLRVRRGDIVTIYGWAVDLAARRPSAGIFGTLDGTVVRARGNMNRDDVASAFKDRAYAPSGFALDIATAGLPLGRSMLSLHGIDAAGTSRYDLGPPIALIVTQR